MAFLELQAYVPPPWAAHLSLVPSHRVSLARTPTPVQRLHLPGLRDGVELWLKRDDMTGSDLSGNKVRKLEFLLADALRQGCDSVVTVGGIQSNHARATAVAARLLGLEAHAVLRCSASTLQDDPQLVGNLLPLRLSGAHAHLVTREEYGRVGSRALVDAVAEQLRAAGKRPYCIPVGGSNALGSWGYLECVQELVTGSAHLPRFDHIALACGSGGTAAGVALGVALSGLPCRVTAFGVCDDPDYFYDHVTQIFSELGAPPGTPAPRECLRIVQSRGAGYAISRPDELDTIARVAASCGVVLDPVYVGKAMHALLQDMECHPDMYSGSRVLLLHTGGLFGAYDKAGDLLDALYRVGGGHLTRGLTALTPEARAGGREAN